MLSLRNASNHAEATAEDDYGEHASDQIEAAA
jgi:hypothetical protein